jgi:hypothetical protein
MPFKVYSGPAGTEAISPMNKDRMLFKEFSTFDEALSFQGLGSFCNANPGRYNPRTLPWAKVRADSDRIDPQTLIRSFPRKRESRSKLLGVLCLWPWVPAFAGTSG